MRLTTYLNFGGNCEEAFKFYEQHLGGKINMLMRHGETPGGSQTAPDWHDKVLHASITLGGTEVAGADIPTYLPMRSAYLTLNVDSDAEADRLYPILTEGGEIFMPMSTDTFFASRFAMFRDRFGTSWMLIRQKTTP